MMVVDTELRMSPIHGIGVFLLEPVRRHDLIWRFDSRTDKVFTADEVAGLPPHMRRFISTYSTWHEASGLWVLCGDNGRHFNHSATPNTISKGISFGDDHAADDLPVGTELTSDYATICDHVRAHGIVF